MAHSLSPPPFHSYQCSTSADSHVGYNSANSSYRQHHRNEIVTKEKPRHGASPNRLRLMSLKGKSWGSFSEAIGCESSNFFCLKKTSIFDLKI